MGLAVQAGNTVTLSYRGDQFTRIKDRNSTRLKQFADEKKLTLVMNSQVKEIRQNELDLQVDGEVQVLKNDFVWVFAGGEPPTAFLQKVGVQIGEQIETTETLS